VSLKFFGPVVVKAKVSFGVAKPGRTTHRSSDGFEVAAWALSTPTNTGASTPANRVVALISRIERNLMVRRSMDDPLPLFPVQIRAISSTSSQARGSEGSNRQAIAAPDRRAGGTPTGKVICQRLRLGGTLQGD
jgi:hypothetical protein